MDVLSQLNHWLNTPGNEALHHAFTEFLRLVLLPARLPGIELPIMHELSEVRAMLSERVKEWTQQWEQQGLQRGRQEGLNAERFLLARQAKRRFGAAIVAQFELSIAIIDDSEQLALIGEWLIDCNTGEELLQQVEQFVKQTPTN